MHVGSSNEITCVFTKGIGKTERFYSSGDKVFLNCVGTGLLEISQEPSCHKNLVTGVKVTDILINPTIKLVLNIRIIIYVKMTYF
jgi:hypothetical protein